ncbi:MAG TPA: ABC transporter permease [Micromonosporaceae bacterium]|jgi:peptide/nickel transport system permease protein
MAVTEVRGSSTPTVDDAPPPAPAGSAAWRRNFQIAWPAALLGLVLFACFVLPFLAPIPKPIGGSVLNSLLPSFSPGHPFGTDPNGNDILSRVLYGGRTSIMVALAVNLIGLAIGGGLGAIAGHLGGIGDSVIMRLFDVLIAIPSLALIVAVSLSLGPGVRNTILTLAFFSVPAFARIARAETLRLREQPFMVAAKLSGTPMWRVVLRHIAPNVGPSLMTFAMLGLGVVMVIEGALSFLGLGIQRPSPSWGNMIADGQLSLSGTPNLVLWPSIALFLTVVAFNQLGEGLRSRWSGGR